MKRIFALILVILLFLSLVGCVRNISNSSQNKQNQNYNTVSDNRELKHEENIKEENIIFQVNNTMPKYCAEFIYDKNDSDIAKSIIITDFVSKKEIQTIELNDNEFFSDKKLYIEDINFDGNLDLIIPYCRSAPAAMFQGYLWNSVNNKFIEVPSFKELWNFAIDKENHRILTHRTASMITSYGMLKYNPNKKDFECTNSLYWEPTSDKKIIHFVEDSYDKNGKSKTVKDINVSSTDGIWVNAKDSAVSRYFEKNSFWDLNGEKWNRYIFKLK